MTIRKLRLPAGIGALLATALVAQPSFGGEETLCTDCVFQCPDEEDEDAVCEAICDGTYEDAVCDDHPTECVGRNVIICEMQDT